MQKSNFIAQERVGGVQKATELKWFHGELMRWQEGGRGKEGVRQLWGGVEETWEINEPLQIELREI